MGTDGRADGRRHGILSHEGTEALNSRNAAKELQDLDEVINAIAHPTRRRILMVVLFRGGEMTSGDIADRFQCAWPTTVRHLRVLEQSGLLVQRKEGRTSRYRIAKERLHLVEDWLRWFRQPQKESVI